MTVDTQPAPPAPVPAPAPAPVVTGTRVDWAPVPKVNLLPPEIMAARRFRQVQRRLGAVVLGVVALSAGAVVWAQSGVGVAEDDLAATQAQTVQLQRQQAKYAEVPTVLTELETARTARESALGTDVAWYRFLSDLAVNTPTGAELSSVTITMTGQAATVDSTVPLTPSGLGDVKVTGKAQRFLDVATWLDEVGQINGLSGSMLQSAARSTGDESGNLITYNGTVVITPAALTHRYDRKAN